MTPDLTAAELDALEALHNATTPDWMNRGGYDIDAPRLKRHGNKAVGPVPVGRMFAQPTRGISSAEARANMELAIALRNAATALLRAARREQRMRGALREIQDDCETVARDETITIAERRTWHAIAHKCANAIKETP